MPEHLPLTALKAFEATARHASFSKAADELHVTTGAVSQQIKSLEEILGVKLFHRLPRGLELTDAARAALPGLSSGFAEISAAVRQIRETSDTPGLRVRSAPSFAAKWLLPRLAEFVAAHPDIDVSLAASDAMIGSGQAVEMFPADSFHQENIDVGIFFGSGEFAGYRADRLFEVSLVPLCSPKLVRSGKHRLRRPQDLEQHRLLHDDTAYEGRPDWQDWLREAGVEGVDPQRGLRFNQVALALEAAIAGQGVVLAMYPLAQADIDAGRLVIPFEPAIKLDYAYYVVSLEDNADKPGIRAFRDWLLAASSATAATPE